MKSAILIFIFAFIMLPTTNQNQSDNEFSDHELIGKVDYADLDSFTLIDKAYTSKNGIYLRNEAYTAFKDMYYAAKECGVNLTIISAARNFDYQKGIWERKWKDGKYIKYFGAERARAIMKYSSMPGTSRHHWGTDIDINSLNDNYFLSGKGQIEYEWLKAHASKYGYYQTYTPKETGRTGYEEEKWHWSYLPLSKSMLNEYNKKITYKEISGFNGSESASDLAAIEKYVNGIDGSLK